MDGQENSVSNVANDALLQPIEQQQQPIAQKMLPQDEVNRIVAREKAKAAESAKRESDERYARELEALRSQQNQRNAEVPKEIDANSIYQQVTERWNKEMQERQLKDQMTQIANNYIQKVTQAKTAYQDYDEVTKDFDPTAFPQVTYLVSGLENGGDVVYDLSKNPAKLAMIDRLAERSPQMAKAELLKLSKSISDNKQSQSEYAQNQNVAEPLDRLSPSRVAGSNGKMSISDLRRQAHLRSV